MNLAQTSLVHIERSVGRLRYPCKQARHRCISALVAIPRRCRIMIAVRRTSAPKEVAV